MQTTRISPKRAREILDRFPGAELLGVGRRSVVLRKGKLAIKIEKESHRGTAAREARWLAEADGIGPKLVGQDQRLGYVVYNYISGRFLPEFIEQCSDKRQLSRILALCLKKAAKLDSLGINKEEMHRPVKHIIVSRSARFIDFERCYRAGKPKNVTQLCHFLFLGSNTCAKKIRKVFHINARDALRVVKSYRESGLKPVLLLLDPDNVAER